MLPHYLSFFLFHKKSIPIPTMKAKAIIKFPAMLMMASLVSTWSLFFIM